MSFSHWLESPAQFRQLLTIMMSDKWEQLEMDFSLEDPVLRQFAATRWAQRRLPEEPRVLAVASLLIAYHYRCLLLDSVRPEKNLQGEVNVTLLLPLYIWPAYRIWILQEFPPKSRLNQMDAVRWLLDAEQRETGFAELEIEAPDSKLFTYLELKQTTTNLSRWIKDGLDRLYHAVRVAMIQSPYAQRREFDIAERSFVDNTQKMVDPPQDVGGSRASESNPAMSDTESKDKAHFFRSPIFQPYLHCSEVTKTWEELKRNGQTAPSLIEVARTIIEQRIQSPNLGIGQRASALELLSDIAEWINIENESGQSISLKSVAIRWRQFHSSDPSHLIQVLLESGLIQIVGLEGRVRFANPMIYDFFGSMVTVKHMRSTNPIPPAGQDLSAWLYWLVNHWLKCGDAKNAGSILWYASGTLPGYRSGTWRQLTAVLEHFPEIVAKDSRLILLAAIAQEVISRNEQIEPSYSIRRYENDFSSRISQLGNLQASTETVFGNYMGGLEKYLVSSQGDPNLTLEIALGFNLTTRNDPWCRKHAFSHIRDRDPKEKIEIGWIPYLYKQKTLQEVVIDYAQKEAIWDLKLAAIELMTTWEIPEGKVFLVEDAIRDLPNEYYYRARILSYALDGRDGYIGWV